MVKDLVISRSILLNATPERVWEALTHPGMTKHYMFNCEVNSEFKPGSKITWQGTYDGEDMHQTGEILDIIPGRLLRYSTYDPRDHEDGKQTLVHITYELTPRNGQTLLLTTLDNFEGDDLRAEQVAYQWDFDVLPKLKSIVETTL